MKSIWKSKTWWVNALTLAATVGTAIAGSDLIAEHPQAAAIAASVVAGVNMALRLITSVPASF